jgi:hypothetical protein
MRDLSFFFTDLNDELKRPLKDGANCVGIECLV